jgi:hypothetical protein
LDTQAFHSEKPLDYAFILTPPKALGSGSDYSSVQLDFGRLFLGWIIVGGAAGYAIYYLRDPQRELAS